VPAMGVDAWSDWAGSAPQTSPGMPPLPPGPADLGDLYDLIVTRAARLAGTKDALLWLADDEGPRAGLGVPLVAGGSVAGVLLPDPDDPADVCGRA
jgi:hypothetical protein